MHRLLRRTLFTGSAALCGRGAVGRAERFCRRRGDRSSRSGPRGGGRQLDHPVSVPLPSATDSRTRQHPCRSAVAAAGRSPSPTRPPTRPWRATPTSRTRRSPKGRARQPCPRAAPASGPRPGPAGRRSATRPSRAAAVVHNTQSNTNAPTVGRARWWWRVGEPESNSAINSATAGEQQRHHPGRQSGPGVQCRRCRWSTHPGAVEDQSADVSNGTHQSAGCGGVRNGQSNTNAPTVGRWWWRRVGDAVELG